MNRGWVPKSRMNPVTRPQGQVHNNYILNINNHLLID